jgi:hypothetical protein
MSTSLAYLTSATQPEYGKLEAIAVIALAALLALVGVVCFGAMIWSSRKKPFNVKRTGLTISGDNRMEISEPLLFAIGTALCLGLAVGLIAYRNTSSRVASDQSASDPSLANGKK